MPATARTLNSARFLGAVLPLAATALAVSTLAAPAADAADVVSDAPRIEPQQTMTKVYRKPKVDNRIQQVLTIMRAQQGDPYSYGSAGPNAFDCSGLVYYATHRAGFKGVPRTSGAQASYMRRISKSAIKPGDFVFMGSPVYHVGVYVGGNKILHASRPGTPVRVDPIWTSSWFAGTLRRG